MSMTPKPNDGGPAFPKQGFRVQPDGKSYYETIEAQRGMTLRDYFAAAALPIAAKGKERTAEDIALRAYYIADAMLAQREKGQQR
jgi:hypothetical protein